MVQHDVAGIEEENDIIINPYYNINIIFKKKRNEIQNGLEKREGRMQIILAIKISYIYCCIDYNIHHFKGEP